MLSRSREEIKREIFELRLELDKKGFSQEIAPRKRTGLSEEIRRNVA